VGARVGCRSAWVSPVGVGRTVGVGPGLVRAGPCRCCSPRRRRWGQCHKNVITLSRFWGFPVVSLGCSFGCPGGFPGGVSWLLLGSAVLVLSPPLSPASSAPWSARSSRSVVRSRSAARLVVISLSVRRLPVLGSFGCPPSPAVVALLGRPSFAARSPSCARWRPPALVPGSSGSSLSAALAPLLPPPPLRVASVAAGPARGPRSPSLPALGCRWWCFAAVRSPSLASPPALSVSRCRRGGVAPGLLLPLRVPGLVAFAGLLRPGLPCRGRCSSALPSGFLGVRSGAGFRRGYRRGRPSFSSGLLPRSWRGYRGDRKSIFGKLNVIIMS